MSKTLLLIGGTGFFGKSILKYFLYNINSLEKRFSKIIILSRGVVKTKIDRKINEKIRIIKIFADISKLKKIPFADYVIYCAINHNYNEDYKAVCNYFKLAKKYHLRSRVLFTSSGAVYGQQPKLIKKIKENYLLNNKRINFKDKNKNNYSITKLKNEEIFKKLAKSGIKVAIARCFAFVGKYLPRDSNYVVGNFIQNILNKKKIEIKSDYHVIRSYMYETDLVVWLFRIVKNSSLNCPIYNVGSDQEINIRNLAFYLSNKYKLPLKIEKIKLSFEDRYLPSILKAKKELNLKLQYSNFRAINEVIKGLKNN